MNLLVKVLFVSDLPCQCFICPLNYAPNAFVQHNTHNTLCSISKINLWTRCLSVSKIQS